MNELVNTTNPTLGVSIFALGGLAGAVFYLPFKKVKNWAWESYWFIYAVFGLVVVPWVLAFSTSPNVLSVLKQSPQPNAGLLLPLRRDVGPGRADLGPDDPLPGCRVGPGHRLRPLLGHRHAHSAHPGRQNSAASMARRPPTPPWRVSSSPWSASSWSAWPACPRKTNCPRK